MKGILLITTLVLLATAAGAEHQDAGQQGTSNAVIGFDDMRAACLNPGQYHNQSAPANIQISCKDVQVKWLPDQEVSISMSGSRQITTAVQSDKYTVEAVTEARAGAKQALACPRFKEVAETVETVRGVTCDELIAYKGGATDFCAGVLDLLRTSNAAAVNFADTGRSTDFCAKSEEQSSLK
ncbi:MAG: hypothetical protein SGJ18_14115 [Pseudomonadota bacterium]|nr:hypothetical protein [Pseudomonadota bacterium]